jgi:hypothetical protein
MGGPDMTTPEGRAGLRARLAATGWAVRKESARRGNGYELHFGGIVTRGYPTYEAAVAAARRSGAEDTDAVRSAISREEAV